MSSIKQSFSSDGSNEHSASSESYSNKDVTANNKSNNWLKNSNFASLLLHIIILSILFYSTTNNTLVASRSNGMQVAVISSISDLKTTMPTVAPSVMSQPPLKTQPVNYDALSHDSNADITLKTKQTNSRVEHPPKNNITHTNIKPQQRNTKTLPPILHNSSHTTALNANKNQQINDLLSEISNSASNNGKSKNKAVGGHDSGTANSNNLLSNYADAVIRLVRPYVIIPDNVSSNALTIIEVTLLPNMEVNSIRLIQTSGNHEYDNNVKTAIERAKFFPPLPQGAKWIDYRTLTLRFKPE